MSAPKVVGVGAGGGRTSTWQRRDGSGAAVLIVVGAAFALAAAVDLFLLWVPSRVGDASWEFGTLSRTFASVPMGGLGIALVAFGLIHHEGISGVWVRVVAVVVGVIAVLLALGGGLFGIAATSVMSQTPPEGLMAVRRATIKAVAEATIYTAAFTIVAVTLWRAVGRVGGR